MTFRPSEGRTSTKGDRAAIACILTLAIGITSGCATRYEAEHPLAPSTAFDRPRATLLGRLVAADEAEHPGASGVTLIRLGRGALRARLALADLAERSLDLQYYIWDADVSGRLLGDRLIRAADRGVRVRVLLDDHSVTDRDTVLARIAGHPNIELRAFNPYRHRGRVLDLFTEPTRVNRRSHNKLFIADSAFAIVGGRNIADHYFGVHGDSNYRDLDVAAAGPVVREVSAVFDRFWNSEFAVPYEAFVDDPPTAAETANAIATMRQRIASDPAPYPIAEDIAAITDDLEAIRASLIWAPARILFDDPAKVTDASIRGIAGELRALTAAAEREVLIENAYFVPVEATVEHATRLRERGVRVRVLTNSLASNDVAAVYSGYTKYRDDLIEAGVEVYELRPDSTMKQHWSLLSARSRAGLHTKAMLVDREQAVIGSYNLDPRSANINSETALLVESREFGEQLGAFLDEGVAPENSYRVTLDDGDLRWTTMVDGEPQVTRTAPDTTRWQRFMARVMRIVPLSQL